MAVAGQGESLVRFCGFGLLHTGRRKGRRSTPAGRLFFARCLVRFQHGRLDIAGARISTLAHKSKTLAQRSKLTSPIRLT